MTIKKILILGYVWPEPRSSAAGSRMMELITLFRAQQWEVVFASAAALSEHRADLAELGVAEHKVAINCESFDQFLSGYQPDMVLFDRFFTEEQFGWRVEAVCPDAVRLLDTTDLHSLRHARHQLLKAAQHDCRNETERHQIGAITASPELLRTAMLADEMTQREIASIYRCDLTLMISDVEVDLLQKQFGVPAMLLHHCALMLMPFSVPDQARPTYSERAHFLSIGNFRHAPNWDAVLWLKHALWPKIRQQLPEAQLHIAGSYPPPKATALHHPQQGFHVVGWIPDAHQAMLQARVCLAPLRFGAGIKGKLADAMACGTPSVTTKIGSEAMHGNLAWGGLQADDVESFVEAAVKLYQDQSLWQRAQENGDQILRQGFDRDAIAAALVERLHEADQQREARRSANFVGSMLRHHHHKSTQYMSQWITAKNQLAQPSQEN